MIARFGLAAAVVLQTAALLAMIAMKQYTLSTGTPIVLETLPIDPRSLFRGDYVALNYAVGQLPRTLPGADAPFDYDETVYLLLKRGEPYWQPVSLHRDRPDVPADYVALKGRVQVYPWQQRGGADAARPLTIRYGIEEYFVPEGEGRALERPWSDEKVSVQIAVDRFGNAGIKAILVNGAPRYVERLF